MYGLRILAVVEPTGGYGTLLTRAKAVSSKTFNGFMGNGGKF